MMNYQKHLRPEKDVRKKTANFQKKAQVTSQFQVKFQVQKVNQKFKQKPQTTQIQFQLRQSNLLLMIMELNQMILKMYCQIQEQNQMRLLHLLDFLDYWVDLDL